MQHSPGHVIAETALILFIIWLVFLRKTEEPGKEVSRFVREPQSDQSQLVNRFKKRAYKSIHPLITPYTHPKQEVFLTDKEVDELVKEWKPEPLTPPPDVRPPPLSCPTDRLDGTEYIHA